MNSAALRRKQKRRVCRSACLLFAMLLLFGSIGTVDSAAAPANVFPTGSQVTRVYLDGKEILTGECALINSVTYVPLRKFCNLFDDCEITWNAKTNTATVKKLIPYK